MHHEGDGVVVLEDADLELDRAVGEIRDGLVVFGIDLEPRLALEEVTVVHELPDAAVVHARDVVVGVVETDEDRGRGLATDLDGVVREALGGRRGIKLAARALGRMARTRGFVLAFVEIERANHAARREAHVRRVRALERGAEHRIHGRHGSRVLERLLRAHLFLIEARGREATLAGSARAKPGVGRALERRRRRARLGDCRGLVGLLAREDEERPLEDILLHRLGCRVDERFAARKGDLNLLELAEDRVRALGDGALLEDVKSLENLACDGRGHRIDEGRDARVVAADGAVALHVEEARENRLDLERLRDLGKVRRAALDYVLDRLELGAVVARAIHLEDVERELRELEELEGLAHGAERALVLLRGVDFVEVIDLVLDPEREVVLEAHIRGHIRPEVAERELEGLLDVRGGPRQLVGDEVLDLRDPRVSKRLTVRDRAHLGDLEIHFCEEGAWKREGNGGALETMNG